MAHLQRWTNERTSGWSHPHVWRVMGVMLCSVCLGARGAHEAEGKAQPPLVPAPALQASTSVRPPPTCAELGIPNEPDRVTEHAGKYCGCHEGMAHCRDTNDKCFHEGVWYDHDAGISTSATDCKCVHPPSWTCAVYRIPCPQIEILYVFEFELTSTMLPANSDAHMRFIMKELAGDASKVVLLASQADPMESDPVQKSQRRADVVREELMQRGVAGERIVIENFGLRPLPTDPNVHPPSCTDLSPLNPHARVSYDIVVPTKLPNQRH